MLYPPLLKPPLSSPPSHCQQTIFLLISLKKKTRGIKRECPHPPSCKIYRLPCCLSRWSHPTYWPWICWWCPNLHLQPYFSGLKNSMPNCIMTSPLAYLKFNLVKEDSWFASPKLFLFPDPLSLTSCIQSFSKYIPSILHLILPFLTIFITITLVQITWDENGLANHTSFLTYFPASTLNYLRVYSQLNNRSYPFKI